MSAVKFHKVVGSLPGTLEANSVYFVRTGAGFSIHITNDLGQVEAYNLNTDSTPVESSAYWDFIYSDGEIGVINKWADNTKTDHLLNIAFTFTSGNLTTITITDWVKALTTDISLTWLNGNITNIQVDRI